MKKKTFIDRMHQLRFKIIAAWPCMHPLKVGDVLLLTFRNLGWAYVGKGFNLGAKQCLDLPHLFRKLHWFEDRTLDELLTVQFVRITEYTGYWRVGDCVKVTNYKVDVLKKIVIEYELESTQHSTPAKCIPVTEKEYKAQRKIK